MEPEQRKSIDTQCALIVRQIDIKALWPYLFTNGIYNYDDCNVPKWTENLTNPNTIKEIIFNNTNKRTPCFLQIIKELMTIKSRISGKYPHIV